MSRSPQIIPVTNDPSQTFELPLAIDGTVKSLYLTLRYNKVAEYWVATIRDGKGNLKLDSVPILTGVSPAANMLGQFAYLGIGSLFVLNVGGLATPNYPNDRTLGTAFQLLWDNTPAR